MRRSEAISAVSGLSSGSHPFPPVTTGITRPLHVRTVRKPSARSAPTPPPGPLRQVLRERHGDRGREQPSRRRADLLASVNDAREVDLALGRLGVPAANRLVLLDGQASACGVRDALEWLVAAAAPEASAVVFFAGHARQRSSGERVLVAARRLDDLRRRFGQPRPPTGVADVDRDGNLLRRRVHLRTWAAPNPHRRDWHRRARLRGGRGERSYMVE